jgi:hypothetical protein
VTWNKDRAESPQDEIQQDAIQPGTIMIEEGSSMPMSLLLEGAPAAEGWKAVDAADRQDMERKIRQAGLIFFRKPEVISAKVFGFNRRKALKAALERVIAMVKLQKCNGLQITEISTKSFLMLPYVSVSAQSRHIQERSWLAA